jgi:hypothetical protein
MQQISFLTTGFSPTIKTFQKDKNNFFLVTVSHTQTNVSSGGIEGLFFMRIGFLSGAFQNENETIRSVINLFSIPHTGSVKDFS